MEEYENKAEEEKEIVESWWVIEESQLLAALTRVQDGEDPQMVLIEMYANADQDCDCDDDDF